LKELLGFEGVFGGVAESESGESLEESGESSCALEEEVEGLWGEAMGLFFGEVVFEERKDFVAGETVDLEAEMESALEGEEGGSLESVVEGWKSDEEE